nr:MAG TPA: hypothetical protein [Caudoviricetes sp.]
MIWKLYHPTSQYSIFKVQKRLFSNYIQVLFIKRSISKPLSMNLTIISFVEIYYIDKIALKKL